MTPCYSRKRSGNLAAFKVSSVQMRTFNVCHDSSACRTAYITLPPRGRSSSTLVLSPHLSPSRNFSLDHPRSRAPKDSACSSLHTVTDPPLQL
ncbi:hypothetical protein BOTBODRAFT_417958 [Botryobasidium botryosum FD-172 SS1]|uniref:Uncharacterized protein n=1 Tax=Botryobasidium botryosum (strain FD-172 SS1) TaxID=930990 RepID=A0A067MAD6_BOTB1|nr:hypothetical protein BOTBODRAFT_417958 [Botryobasidium botryosum FD-172 SS1]